jgi:hypothetical protein
VLEEVDGIKYAREGDDFKYAREVTQDPERIREYFSIDEFLTGGEAL